MARKTHPLRDNRRSNLHKLPQPRWSLSFSAFPQLRNYQTLFEVTWQVLQGVDYVPIQNCTVNTQGSKVGRLRICQLWKFEWNRRGTESKKRKKWGKNKKNNNAASTGNRTRDLSITDQMSVLTNQVHLKIQFRHRFDQKSPFTDSLHRLGSRFARTSSVPLRVSKM